jgi:hypothetical protein
MRRWKNVVVALVLAMGLASCVDNPMGPEPQTEQVAQDRLLGGLLGGVTGVVRGTVGLVTSVVEGLLGAIVRSDPLETTTTVAKWVGPQGGVVSGAGVELRIPRGALKEWTRITMVVPAGEYVQAEFLPHGLQFAKPAQLRFDMSGTSAERGARDSMVGAYLLDEIVSGSIEAQEVIPATLERGEVRFTIDHFSWYAPARRGYTPAGG